MGEIAGGDAPELLDVAGTAEPVETTIKRGGVDLRVVALVIAVLVAAVLLLLPAGTSEGDRAVPGSSPEPAPGRDDDGSGTTGSDQLEELTGGDLGGVTGARLAGLRLQVVVTSPSHGDSVVLRVDGDELLIEEVPSLDRFAFDASGQWLAGMSTSENGPRRQVLWAGPIGGDFEPVAVGVRTFSWHDSQPAALAWSNEGQSEVTTVGLTSSEPDRVFKTPVRGRIRGWGDWGFAINYWDEGSATALLSRAGELIAADLPGRFNGNLPGSGLVLSGSSASDPLLVDPETGASRTAPWLGSDDYVWALAVAEDDPAAAALVGPQGRRADPFTAEVTVIDAAGDEASDVFVTTEAFTDLALSADGEWIVLARQQGLNGDPSGEIVAVSRSGDQTLRLAVPDLFAGREWVSALAVG